MNKFHLYEIDSGYCRLTFKEEETGRLITMQEEGHGHFLAYAGSADDEPCSLFPVGQQFLEHIVLPDDGYKNTMLQLFRAWHANEVMKDIVKRENNYFTLYGGTTEEDMSINDISREKICRVKEVYGKCYLVKLNHFGLDKLTREKAVFEAKTHDKTDGDWNLYNFCGDFVTPCFDDELTELIIKRHNSPCSSREELVTVDQIFKKVEQLGGLALHWA